MSEFIKTGVIGHPISHSKSPLIHNYWIKEYGLSGEYKAIDIPCENLEGGVRGLIDDGYAGFNLTLPHKELIIPLCDVVAENAQVIGAVNTVIINKGEIIGTNTDAFGFVTNIKQDNFAFDFKAGTAVVLGAGGAARAVIYGLLEEGVPEIILLNRTKEKAESLMKTTPDPARIKVAQWDKRSEYLAGANLLVNTTSLGMIGQPALEIDLSAMPESTLVNDIVYAPLHTDLLVRAKERGNPVVTGIGMLLQQARPGFERWYGVMPEVNQDLLDVVQA